MAIKRVNQFEMNRLKNKNIVITGASSGVGLSIAERCAAKGANLVLLARRWDKLEDSDRYTKTIFRIC